MIPEAELFVKAETMLLEVLGRIRPEPAAGDALAARDQRIELRPLTGVKLRGNFGVGARHDSGSLLERAQPACPRFRCRRSD